MPLYEYKCMRCGEITECLRNIQSSDDATECKWCGAKSDRIMSTFNTGTRNQPKHDQVAGRSRGTGVRMEGGSAVFEGGSFTNLQTGLSLTKGAKVSIQGTRFENVAEPVKVTKE
jgi:putative FmdB family regulatory protein